MKQSIVTFSLLLVVLASSGAPSIKVISNGYWGLNANWSLNRTPASGDTIIIPADKTITVNADENVTGFVYFQVYGKLVFQNNNSTLKLGSTSIVLVYSSGQILGGGSPSQKLKIGNSTVFDGNDPAVMGPRMATSSTNGFQSFAAAPLPVKFVGFSATRNSAGDVMVQWSTAEEENADRYEVERSFDGSNFTAIATVAAAGTSANLNKYSFIDKATTYPLIYYRVKQVDRDGRSTYTTVQFIRGDTGKTQIAIASVQGKILFQFPQELKEEVVIRVISMNGQVLQEQVLQNALGQVVLETKLRGVLVVAVSGRQGWTIAEQVVL